MSKKIQREIRVTCSNCFGSGIVHHFTQGRIQCSKCRGSGQISQIVWEIPQEENKPESL